MTNPPHKIVGEADIYTFYDKARAENDALAFFVDSRACNYETAYLLLDLGALPDARLESLKGPEYGRQFLHDNGRIYEKKVMSIAEVSGCSLVLEEVYRCL